MTDVLTPETKVAQANGTLEGNDREAFAERMKRLLKGYGTASSLAKAVGVSEGAIRKWLHGQAEPGRDNLVALARAAEVSVAWLATGEGPMRPDEVSEGFVYFTQGEHGQDHSDLPKGFEAVDFLAFRSSWLAHQLGVRGRPPFLFRVSSDAMRPTIDEGDLALVDPNRDTLESDGIYLLDDGGRTLLRRVQPLVNGSAIISTDNATYQPQTVSREDLAKLKPLGRVVWTGKAAY